MDDTAKLGQLIAALFLAVGFFLFCYFASPRKTIPWLICLSPFQLIYTEYSTSSVLITYVVGIAYILRGKLRFVPMFGLFLAILAIYAISTGFAHRVTHVWHGLYIFNYLSAILMFYVVYNFVRETKDIDLVIRTLIILNVLVAIHSIIQVTIGPLSLFGLEEVKMYGPRAGMDARLSGPYAAVGITAEFFVFHIFLIAYLLIDEKSALRRNLLYLLMAANLGCLIATANRGGFLSLIGGAGLFLLMFRAQLGVKRTLTLSIAGSFLIVLMSVVVINYTSYGRMYERLESTELESGMPENRAGNWPGVIRRISERPLFGHGPRAHTTEDETSSSRAYEVIQYPHNLYLYLLYTVGFAGLMAYLFLFAWLFVRLRAAIKRSNGDLFMDGFIKLGLLLLVIFLIDQVKVEFLRMPLVDYWHYIFTVFAIWLAFADMQKAQNARNDRQPVPRSLP